MSKKPLMRIPYTNPLPPPLIIPPTATTIASSIAALTAFLRSDAPNSLRGLDTGRSAQTVLLTGAGISVASGLADYRGANGTYTQNKSYRPVYYHEFVQSHESRKRYWARSFLGWNILNQAKPNRTHEAIAQLGDLGVISSVITQNVDSFHKIAHPDLSTLELHGFLRSLICVSCGNYYPRVTFQEQLKVLNPTWSEFLDRMLESGALTTENPEERARRGLRSNPDGDVDVPGAPYTTFRYPACPTCLSSPPHTADGTRAVVATDADGAWIPPTSSKYSSTTGSGTGILKPAVIMFGESIPSEVKTAAEEAIDEAGKILVLGSSLATYSAWRLVKRAVDRGMKIGIVNLGGVRKEEGFFDEAERLMQGDGSERLRIAQSTEDVLPSVVEAIRRGV